MQKRRILSLLCLVLFVLSLTVGYINLPDSFILYKDRGWTYGGITQINIDDKSIETSQNAIIPRNTGDYKASLSIFGIPYKKVNVKVLEDEEVLVGGEPIGIRLYSDGLVVVAVGRVNENKKSPAETAGIKEGDVIVSVDGEKVGTPSEFSDKIAASEGEMEIGVLSGEKEKTVTVMPEVSVYDGVKRIGLWVRDSTAGVGTLTYINPDSMTYGALGHGVSDADTGVKFAVREGSIEECAIAEIKKGEKGNPGELKGAFLPDAKVLGNITKNEKEGIFGSLTAVPEGESVPLGHKSEIKKGKAYIRTCLDGKEIADYEIEITKVSKNGKNPSKGLVIKVTDERLIDITGGIVQGMSGSPILQDGKLIGAVTHVLVNDPTKGYGIFIENMIEAGTN
ncbi:MAG: SpoIVB peptidase [Clostridia bacterium]|nr:SpoIVB peptidase [Clostridia bacterium]